MTALQPRAEPWKIFLPVTQVLGKQAGEAGWEMRLQAEGLPGYQSLIPGPFLYLLFAGEDVCGLLLTLLVPLPSVLVLLGR